MSTDAKHYLDQTEPAVMDLFASLSRYTRMYEQLDYLWPDLIEKYTDDTTGGKMWRSRQPSLEEKAQLDKYLQRAQECMGYSFAQATLCGSILQIAFMGIRLFSSNSEVPASCTQIVDSQQRKAVTFCIGREIHGLPIGMIIYAARNQYNHLDDDSPRQLTQDVFSVLTASHYNHPFLDLAFDLGNPLIDSRILAGTVVTSVLGWRNYADYHADMKELLLESF